jgi:hypothetical protein
VSASYAFTASSAILASASLIAISASYALNAANAFVQNGNSFGTQAVLGTNDLQNLVLETNGTSRIFISSSGAYVGIGGITPSNGIPQALLDVNGLIRPRNGIQIIGDTVTTVLSSSRSDNTFGGTMLFNGWGDYAFNNSLLVGYNSTTLAPVGLNQGILAVSSKVLIGKTGSSAAFDVNGNAIITGSLIVLSGITGSLFGTASQALTASYVLGGGGVVTFPYSGSAQITGSLGITGSLSINGSLLLGQSTSSLGISTQTVSTNATSSYTSIFYNYTLASGSNARAGQVVAVWSGSAIQYMDNSTTDIGNTALVALTASLSAGNVLLTTVLPTAGWTVKTLVNLL